MNEQQLRELIRQIVLEALEAPEPMRLTPQPDTALVLFTGAGMGFDEAIESLHQIKRSGIQLDFAQTPSAEQVLDQEKIAALDMTPQAQSKVFNHQMLIVPTATVNLASKAALAIADDLGSNLMTQFIQSSRPIVFARNGCCPDTPSRRQFYPDLPAAYRETMRSHLQLLASYGVTLADASELANKVAQLRANEPKPSNEPIAVSQPSGYDFTGKLLSNAVLGDYANGATVRIKVGTLITPLARDEAESRGITLLMVP